MALCRRVCPSVHMISLWAAHHWAVLDAGPQPSLRGACDIGRAQHLRAQRFRGPDLDFTKEGESQLELLDERAQAGIDEDLRPASAQSLFADRAGRLPVGPLMLDPSPSPLESKHD